MNFKEFSINYNEVTQITDITGSFEFRKNQPNLFKVTGMKPAAAILRLRSNKLDFLRSGIDKYCTAADYSLNEPGVIKLERKYQILDDLRQLNRDNYSNVKNHIKAAEIFLLNMDKFEALIPDRQNKYRLFLHQSYIGLLEFATNELEKNQEHSRFLHEAFTIPCEKRNHLIQFITGGKNAA